jgi:acyl carrier protein phosphodiesterase
MGFVESKYIALFANNWLEALRTATRLSSSLNRLAVDFPISAENLKAADEDLQDKIDAFRVRFADLQDCIGHKLFRNLLKLEDESPVSMIDVLNMMEKREILTSSHQWKLLREVRNAFSHDYPESETERAEALNLAWANAGQLLLILANLKVYLSSVGITLEGDVNALK